MTEARNDGRPALGLSAAAAHRLPVAEFLPSFVQLQDAVRKACAGHAEWEAKIAAGVHAMLEFAAANPAAATALTIDGRRAAGPDADREREVTRYFAELLGDVAPAEKRSQLSTDEAIIGSIAIIVRSHLLAGMEDQLPALGPELVYLVLMPYAGIDEARRWADSFPLRRH